MKRNEYVALANMFQPLHSMEDYKITHKKLCERKDLICILALYKLNY